MRRKRFTAVGLAFLLCIILASCADTGTEPAESTAAAGETRAEAQKGMTSDETLPETAVPEGITEEQAEAEGGTLAENYGYAMTLEEFPVIDGSLACVPMIEQLMSRFTGCSEIEADDLVNRYFSNTNPCYLNLAAGERDICIAYEPAQDTVEKLKAYPALDMEPIGRDALVFIVNENNPVDELTREQLTDIFTGKIRNWSEVGGEDIPIEVFTRPETSGSQTLMRKLLVGDADMTDEKYYYLKPTMEGMVEEIKEDYDNTEMAIGYSVYYYVDAMMGTSGLKILKVDGIVPSNETISSGEYPLVNDFYAVLREDSPSGAVEIRDWLLSEEGQAFVKECGYVPAR